jgi:glyceraldehyde 3-phosphate dehydrogenase
MDTPDLHLVAANDIGTSESVEYLLRYDTVYGRYDRPIQATDSKPEGAESERRPS